MLELFFKINPHFTESDKEECKSVIYRIIDLANLARQKGILALELEMDREDSFFLKTAIGLVADGTDPILVKQILQNIILADQYSGSQLLGRLLMAEGILSIQQGENPRIIALKLSAMLGEKYILQINEELSMREYGMTNFYHFLRTLKDKKPFPESIQFESKFIQLDNRSIQLVLRGIDDRCLLTAFHGCSFALIQKISENVSMNTCLRITDDWEVTKTLHKESILKCQEEILRRIVSLESSGEIVDISRYFSGK